MPPLVPVRFQKLHPNAVMPVQAHVGDAGLDLSAVDALTIPQGGRALVRTGLAVEIPEGHEGQVRPRSGLALRHGVTVLNAPGTIDSGYRGELGVILANFGSTPFQVEPGMRIAQLVIAPVASIAVEVVDGGLSATDRGAGGFGSSGVAPLPPVGP